MIQLQRILVPTDFSEYSKKALRYAAEFARLHSSEVVLLHVLELPLYPVSFGVGPVAMPPIEEELKQAVQRQLRTWQQQELAPPLRSHALSRNGRAFLEICHVARELKVDLIVIATHGYTGMKHVLLGSTAEKVVRKAPCPVLVVRDGEREFVLP